MWLRGALGRELVGAGRQDTWVPVGIRKGQDMLSRTASNLFWMGRHLERAETAARLLDVGARITLCPIPKRAIATNGNRCAHRAPVRRFPERYGDRSFRKTSRSWLFSIMTTRLRSRPASNRPRKRPHRAHGADQPGLGRGLNTAFQELRALERKRRSQLDPAMLTDFTTRHSSAVRGAINATQLRNDGWHFINLGYSLERADATARLLDVKYYVLLPAGGIRRLRVSTITSGGR